MSDERYHIPVLLKEVIEGLHVISREKYIDATLGGGGHTLEILKRGGFVLGIDVDFDARAFAKERIEQEGFSENVVVAKGNFRDIDIIAKDNGFEKVAGVLFDFGVSSFQLDSASKGFSFLRNGPLDMRMDQTLSVTAADLVNGLRRSELIELFEKFGEERNAQKIAQYITIERQFKKIETTDDLVAVIEKAYGVTNEVLSTQRRAQMCMRVFQALRMAVNNELEVIRESLPKAFGLLRPFGRLAVISFHSLEDRIVKETFLVLEKKELGRVITKKPIIAGDEETEKNRRSRSAKLRIIEKI